MPASDQPIASEQVSPTPVGQKTKSAFALGIHKMSNAIFRPPLEPTVVRRTSPKSRPLLKGTVFQTAESRLIISPAASSPGHTTDSNTNASRTSASNSNSPTTTSKSTGRSPVEPTFKDKDPNTVGRERGSPLSPLRTRHSPGSNASGTTPSSSPSSPRSGNLDPIQETPFHQYTPGIATVERAAAAKIYLETYFNELLASGPSPRQMRQQILETDLFNRARDRGAPLSAAEMQGARARFCRRESEHLRDSRVMKARNLEVIAGARGRAAAARGPVGEYETVKVLGKGSFGVVRLVRECRRGQVYAMKVIKKGKMLKTSQEGHLRAERDMLVASEGSRW